MRTIFSDKQPRHPIDPIGDTQHSPILNLQIIQKSVLEVGLL